MTGPVLIAASIPEELAGYRRKLNNPKEVRMGGRQCVQGTLYGTAVHLLATGPGLVNAVQSLTAAIEVSKPALIIQTGCAGGFEQAGMGMGDIGIATEETDVHLGIESENDPLPARDLPFPIGRYGKTELFNTYPLDSRLAGSALEIIRAELDTASIRTVAGPFVTVSTVTATDRRARILYDRFSACMESMEGAGAALLSIHYSLPFLQIRSASNRVGKRNRRAWNLPMAFDYAARAVLAVIRNLGHLKLD